MLNILYFLIRLHVESSNDVKNRMTEDNIINIAISIYFTIPVDNYTAIGAFSKIVRIKNENRSALLQDNRAFCLQIMNNDVLENLNFEYILKEFVS